MPPDLVDACLDSGGDGRADARAVAIDGTRIRGSGVAWPTIALAVAAALCWWTAVLCHIAGALDTPAAAALAFVAAYASLTPAHEAAHGNISGRAHPWLDVAVGQLGLFCLLGPFLPFRTVHLRHHAHTNDPERDPDMWMSAPKPLVPLRAASILQYYWWCYWCPPPGVRAEHHHRRYAIVFFSLLGLAFGALTATGHATTVLIVVVVPAWLALGVLAVVFTLLPHHPHRRGDRFLNSRARPGRWRTALLLGQNYHLVHHLWPTVPWYRYGVVFRRNRSALRARGADVGEGTDVGEDVGEGDDIEESLPQAESQPRASRAIARCDGSR